ncbi:hypothetical protein D3C84_977170 [compost metagenome]
MRQRGLGHRFSFANPCPGAVGRHVPGQRRAEAPAVGGWLAKVFQDTDRADGRADADVRVQLTGSDTDTGGRGRQSPFGLADVGAALEQRCTITHRQQLRNFWQFGAAIGAGR